MANRNFYNKFYSGHAAPVEIDCNFIVDSANGNGLGLRSLKGPYVQAAYMHTSATPAAGSPQPGTGLIVIQLQDNYSRLFTGSYSIVSPLSGSLLAIDSVSAALTVGQAYTIAVLGNATLAQLQAIGLPKGLTPSVGMSFIAKATGSGAVSTTRVEASVASGIARIETVGDPNQSLAPNGLLAQGFGAQLIFQCYNSSGAAVAPADGTVISLMMLMSNSSVVLQGE